MVVCALLRAQEQRGTLAEIVDSIASSFVYFRVTESMGWKARLMSLIFYPL